MKKIFTICSLFFATLSYSQTPSLEVWTLNAAGTSTILSVPNGTTIAYTTSASNPTLTSTRTVKIKYKNTSSANTNTYSVVRTDITINPGASAYFCFGDLGTCFPSSTTEPGSSDYSVLGPGAETIPGTHMTTDLDEAFTIGYSEVRYKLYNVATGKTSADTLSFTIKYNQLLGINENSGVIDYVSDIYPNPSSNHAQLTVLLAHENIVKVQVFNSIGSLVFNGAEQKLSGKNKLSVDCTNFNSGLYFITVTAGNSKVTKRLVVNK